MEDLRSPKTKKKKKMESVNLNIRETLTKNTYYTPCQVPSRERHTYTLTSRSK